MYGCAFFVVPVRRANDEHRESLMLEEGHILIVEDEAIIRFTMVSQFQKKGFRVSEAGSGIYALDIVMKSLRTVFPITAMITDYMMPKMSGLELIQALRVRNIMIPIVILTGFPEECRLSLHTHSGIRVRAKPCHFDELINELGQLVNDHNQTIPCNEKHG